MNHTTPEATPPHTDEETMAPDDGAPFSRGARPAFSSSGAAPPPSTLLFVDVTAPKSRQERREMRAQVSFATHEARRRRTLQGRKTEKRKGKKDADNPAESSALARIHNAQSPLQGASVMTADPFNSLPVETFAGMHDIFTYCKATSYMS
ncbi:hypothetical protein SLS54_009435 [Diplodia seriata]